MKPGVGVEKVTTIDGGVAGKTWQVRRRKLLAMLFLIAILGGLLIMMGQHDRSEALFYYFEPGRRGSVHMDKWRPI